MNAPFAVSVSSSILHPSCVPARTVLRGLACVWGLGALLAGLAGVMGGSNLSIQPGVDGEYLLYSLIVVIIGGMGSIGGAALGALSLRRRPR